MTHLTLTASQTVGPFFHDCLMRTDAACDVLATDSTEGTHIRIAGRVIDGDRAGVPDAVLEVWQANRHGRYNHPSDERDLPLDPAFTGYGRIATQSDGQFCFTTIKPGAVPFDRRRLQAPHISVAVLGRGLLNHLYTRIYFDDEPLTASDPILQRVPTERRPTLIARRASDQAGRDLVYKLDIVLQGAGETVFFEIAGR
ncbi:MAG: protocatechuate 3,4-dioxygenase subunit alpha [Gemmatimonadetes bacterium]|nr:protocatechuate 3,4-dioxygenase subunit alpha [Gemmatimonadota bacterium]